MIADDLQGQYGVVGGKCHLDQRHIQRGGQESDAGAGGDGSAGDKDLFAHQTAQDLPHGHTHGPVNAELQRAGLNGQDPVDQKAYGAEDQRHNEADRQHTIRALEQGVVLQPDELIGSILKSLQRELFPGDKVVNEIGAVLCIENLPRTCLGRNGQEMMALIEGFDNVGICFDVNHLLYQSHADFLSSIKKGSIKTVHISDYNFTDERHLVPGVGDIDWAPVWKGIRNNGYKGVMMFECFGNAEELTEARKLLKGEIVPEKSFIDRDSLAFCNAHWHYADLDKGAVALYAQAPMFFSTQSICAIKYPASEFKTEILHRPGKTAGKPSEIGKEVGATMAVNACFFHVKELIPSVYFRVGENVYGVTDPAETYRVNGVVGFKDKEGKEMCIEYSNISQYEEVTKRKWHSSDYGYVICGASTQMWTPFSPTCQKCTKASLCRERTEHVLHELYRLRIEAWNKHLLNE